MPANSSHKCGTDEEQIRQEVELLLQAVGIKEWGSMYLIGSRVKGTAHSNSDYDVAVMIDESKLPYLVIYHQALLDNMMEEAYLEGVPKNKLVDVHLISRSRLYRPYQAFG